MKKRWFIRSIFIGLLTLCVAAWVGSYWKDLSISCHGRDFGAEIMAIDKGTFGISWSNWHLIGSWEVGLQEPRDYQTSGFMGFDFDGSYVYIPLYFPTLLSALLLWFVWRKTRAKPVGGAFPVEPAKTEGRQT